MTIRNDRGQFVKGMKPWNKGKSVQSNTGITHFKKGQEPWNKGELITKRCNFCNEAFDVHPCREKIAKFCSHKCFSDHRKETKSFKGKNHPNHGSDYNWAIGENNHKWKGDEVGYHALHHWVRRHAGSASMCEECRVEGLSRYHWANISGEYQRNLDDYRQLCPSCHKSYDLGRAN